MCPVDVKDTSGIILDDTLDTEGGGAYEQELTAGSNPGRRMLRHVQDAKLETVNLAAPTGLKDGVQIKLTTRGTEISTVEFDGRQEAGLFRVTREFNTPTAERFNSRVDGTNYPAGTWQGKTIDDVIRSIVELTNGVLLYDGSAPKEFAGPLAFSNTPVPQAIAQVLEIEGNNLWTVKADGVTVTVINRTPGGAPIGKVGVNVVEQSLSGADVTTDRPALVTDKDGRGFKQQYGGPAFFGKDLNQVTEDTFGALPPLVLKPDLADLLRAAKEGGGLTVSSRYGYSTHFVPDRSQSEAHFPRDAQGEPINAELRLVQEAVIGGDLITRNSSLLPPGFQSDLLTHPSKKIAFEMKASGPPSVAKEVRVPTSQASATRTSLLQEIAQANGLARRPVFKRDTRLAVTYQLIQSPSFPYLTEENLIPTGYTRFAIIAYWAPTWQPLDGLVDYETGEFIPDSGPVAKYSNFLTPIPVSPGIVSAGFAFDQLAGAKRDSLGNLDPIVAVSVNFELAIRFTEFRAHVVTVLPVESFVFPVGSNPPFGAVEQGDFEVHNVIKNAARERGFLEPDIVPQDDRPRMAVRAENLAKSLLLPSMARGSIVIFPGDLNLQVGQPANGGMIVKIKHSFVPYFKTQFWLEGAVDIDNPEQRHFRKKIGEHEGLSRVNSQQIGQVDRRADSANRAGGAGGSTVSQHTHDNDKEGGNRLGNISVGSLIIDGLNEDGTPAFQAARGATLGQIDLKWVPGLNRLVSGDLVMEVEVITDAGRLEGPIVESEPGLPKVTNVRVIVAGDVLTTKAEVEQSGVQVGDQRALVFLERADPNKPPVPAVIVETSVLICDHDADDEEIPSPGPPADPGNLSTKVFRADRLVDRAGDLDDALIVFERPDDKTPGASGLTRPRLQLYMAEKDFAGDRRKGYITGPHKDSSDRKDRKIGDLADVFRYWQQDDNENLLTVRTDALFGDDNAEGFEGPVSFFDLHRSSTITGGPGIDGFRGIELLYDDADWSGAGGKKRGKRYKGALICDHINPHTKQLPTGAGSCNRNESTQVFESNLSSRGDLDDILKVHLDHLMLYMEERDPCQTAAADPCTAFTKRNGYITNGNAFALLADVLTYEDPGAGGGTRLDIMTDAHFIDIDNRELYDGPIWFDEKRVQVGSFGPGPFIYGRMVLDTDAPPGVKCNGLGAWIVEISLGPDDIPVQLPCQEPFLSIINALHNNTVIVNNASFARDNAIIACVTNWRNALCASLAAPLGAINAAICSVADCCELKDNAAHARMDELIIQVNAAISLLATSISACACCFPEFIDVDVPRVPIDCSKVLVPPFVCPPFVCGVAPVSITNPCSAVG